LKKGALFAISRSYKFGGSGAISLAEAVVRATNKKNNFKPLYDEKLLIKEKIKIIAKEIYRAADVVYSNQALEEIKKIEELGRDKLPICIAKTQYSITDDASLLGAPIGSIIHVREVKLYNGAEFITVMLGNIMTMPGLPKVPAYENIYLKDGNIKGIF